MFYAFALLLVKWSGGQTNAFSNPWPHYGQVNLFADALGSRRFANQPVKPKTESSKGRLLMLKLPQSIIIAMVALNITAFTILIQLDWFVFGTPLVKLIAWALTIGAWRFAYMRRKKYFTLFWYLNMGFWSMQLYAFPFRKSGKRSKPPYKNHFTLLIIRLILTCQFKCHLAKFLRPQLVYCDLEVSRQAYLMDVLSQIRGLQLFSIQEELLCQLC